MRYHHPDDPKPQAPPGPLEGVLAWVERKQLQVPATILLEMHRPLMPIAWTAAMLFGGLVAPLFGPSYYEKIEALRDTAALDRILKRLERSARTSQDPQSDPPEQVES